MLEIMPMPHVHAHVHAHAHAHAHFHECCTCCMPHDHSQVLQLETAMGAAIASFEGAGAILIPRTRFAPVKTTNDMCLHPHSP